MLLLLAAPCTFAAGRGRSTWVHPINGRLEKRTLIGSFLPAIYEYMWIAHSKRRAFELRGDGCGSSYIAVRHRTAIVDPHGNASVVTDLD